MHLDDKYMIGGKKTDAGKNRAVPIHKKILPLVKEFYKTSDKYLFEEDGNAITYMHFKDYHMIPLMKELEIKHTLHDTRHTCAARVYTHVEIARLTLEINKIKI